METNGDAKSSKKIIVRDLPTQKSTGSARGEKGKELESLLNELIKSMKDLQLRFAKLEKVENLSQQKPKDKRKTSHA